MSRAPMEPGSNAARLLDYVVRESIEGRAELLKGFTIGQDVLGKGDNFDPAKDSAVRVEMKKLRETLDHYYRTEGREDPVRIEIVRGNYQPRFLRQGALPEPPAAQPRGSLPAVLLGAGLLAVAGLAAALWLFVGVPASISASAGDGEPRIVLTRPDDSSAARLVAKQTLSRFHNVKLFDGPMLVDRANHDLIFELTLEETAEGARAELVHDSSANITATAFFAPDEIGTLDDADALTPLRLWLGQVFGRNGRLESKVRNEGRPSGDFHCSTLTEAYFANQTDETHLAARDCIEAMLAQDYESARLYADLSLITREEFSDQRNLLPGNALDRATKAAQRAIALDPFDAQTHYALMTVLFMAGAVEDAMAAGERALELNPFDAEIVGGFAARVNVLGEHDRALALFEQRARLSPSVPSWMVYGRFLAHLGQGEREAAALAAKTLGGSANPLYLAATAVSARIEGDGARAREAKAALLDREPDIRAMFERRRYAPALVERLMAELDAIGTP